MIVFRSALLVITGPIAVRKHAAALFRREKLILLQVCLTGGRLQNSRIFCEHERRCVHIRTKGLERVYDAYGASRLPKLPKTTVLQSIREAI